MITIGIDVCMNEQSVELQRVEKLRCKKRREIIRSLSKRFNVSEAEIEILVVSREEYGMELRDIKNEISYVLMK